MKTLQFPTQSQKCAKSTASKRGTSEQQLNHMRLEIPALSRNESFARSTVCAFAAAVDPTLQDLDDIKTAVSEAVTNCVVHAYSATPVSAKPLDSRVNTITLDCTLYPSHIQIRVSDSGLGIRDINAAMQPFHTTRPEEERSGMGFTVMQSFMDSLEVTSKVGVGTTITMQKFFEQKSKESAKRKGGV